MMNTITEMISNILTPTTSGLLMLASAVTPAFIIYWLRNDRHKPAVVWFQFAMLSVMIWSISFGVMSLVSLPEVRLIATHFYVLAVSTATIFTFMYCYEFTFKKPVPRSIFILFIPALLLFILSWFNPYNLIYTVENPYQATEILIPANPGSIRPLITVGIGLPLVIMGTGMVLGELMNTSNKMRKIQSIIILIMISNGTILGLIKVLDMVPSYFDPTPIGWAFAGLLFAATVKRYQIFQISPTAEQQILDELKDILYVYNPENVISKVNKTATDVLDIEVGITKKELERRNPEIKNVDTKDGKERITMSVDGNTRTFIRHCSALEYGHGARGELNLLRDVTELANKEQELQQQNERLSEFANEVSHDLKSPLTVAAGYTQLAKDDRETTEYITKVENSLSRMEEIIESILNRAHSGRVPNKELLSLENIARTAWSNINTQSASLTVRTNQELSADSTQLLQLFENIFRNSIEHGDDEINVYVESTSAGFFIADDGPGIPENQQEDIFEQGVTYSKEGTGQGLSIVSNVVEAHGWSISVSTSDHGGAKFDITEIDS